MPEGIGNVDLRTNVLYWLTTTPNVGADIRVAGRWSVGLSFGYNAFDFHDTHGTNPKIHHWLVMPEGRYWFGDGFSGHFAGVNIFGGKYNAGGISFPHFLKDKRFRGLGAGAGAFYGYRHHWTNTWAVEASVGMGYVHLDYDMYTCGACGTRIGHRRRNYPVPSVALSVVYVIPSSRRTLPAQEPSGDIIAALPEPTPIRIDTEEPVQIEPEAPAAVSVASPDTVAIYLAYPAGADDIRASYGLNGAAIARLDSVFGGIDLHRVSKVCVDGYASPEHTMTSNLALSERRARGVAAYIATCYGIPETNITVSGHGEDWEGLTRCLAADPQRAEALAIIRSYGLSEGRKQRLAAIEGGRVYRDMLRNIYPQLRRTEVTVILSPSEPI